MTTHTQDRESGAPSGKPSPPPSPFQVEGNFPSPQRGEGQGEENTAHIVRLWKWRQIPALVFWLAVFAWRIRRRDWFRRFPFLPVPPKGYLRWRMELAYGDYPVSRADVLVDVFNFAYALRQFERM